MSLSSITGLHLFSRGRRHYLAEERVKGYLYQLLKAMDHMHRNGIFHRSASNPANLLQHSDDNV